MFYKLKKISGDASSRKFYRIQKGKKTSIIVEAKKDITKFDCICGSKSNFKKEQNKCTEIDQYLFDPLLY